MKPLQIHPVSTLLGALAVGGAFLLSSWQLSADFDYVGLSPEQRRILGHMSIVYLDDGKYNGSYG